MIRKYFKTSLVLSLSALTIILLAGLLYSELGLKLCWHFWQSRHPQWQTKKIEGALFGPIIFHDLHYKEKTFSINIKQINLNWKLASLWDHNISIKELSARDIDVRQDEQQYHFQHLSGELTLQGELITLKKIIVKEGHFSHHLQGTFDNNHSQKLQIKINSHGKLQQYPKFVSHSVLNGTINNPQLTVNISAPFVAKLHASLNTEKSKPTLTATASWQKLQWPFIGPAKFVSPEGKITLKGLLNAYHFTAHMQMKGDHIPLSTLSLEGHGDTQHFQSKHLQLKTLDGLFKGAFFVKWEPELRWNLNLNAGNLNPMIQYPKFASKVGFKLEQQGNYNKNQLSATTNLTQLHGTFNNQIVSGMLHMKITPKGFIFSDTHVQIGKNTLLLNGGQKKQWDFQWQIIVPELKKINPHLAGEVYSQGLVKGLISNPTVETTSRIDKIQVNHSIPTNIKVSSGGSLGDHNFVLTTNSTLFTSKFIMKTHWQKRAWQAYISKANIYSDQYGSWHLTRKAKLSWDHNGKSISPLCWEAKDKQQFCINAYYDEKDDWQIGFNGEHIATKPWSWLLPNKTQIDSFATFKIHAQTQTAGHIGGAFNLQLSPGKLTTLINNKTQTLPYKGANLTTIIDEQGLDAKWYININEQDQLKVLFSMPKYDGNRTPKNTQALQGSANINLSHLELIANLIPTLNPLQGKLTASMKLSGTIAKPNLQGKLLIDNARINVVPAGITADKIRIDAQGNGNGLLSYHGRFNLGKGQANFAGKTALFKKDYPTEIKIEGKNLNVINTGEYNITADPDLTLSNENGTYFLKGKITIPQAKLQPKDFSQIITMPPETVIKQKKAEEKINRPLPLKSQITLLLGKKVNLKYSGLEGQLTGKLLIRDEPGRDTTAKGEIHIQNGTYQYHNDELTIKSGQLIFVGGPINKPRVSAVASKTIKIIAPTASIASPKSLITNTVHAVTNLSLPAGIKAVEVGVKVSGTIDNPKITLYSNPPMSPGDIFSYLLLGVSLNDATTDPTNLAFLAMKLGQANLGGNSINNIVQKLKSHGLNEIKVQNVPTVDSTTNTVSQQTSLILGKALSSRLYVRYIQSLFNKSYLFQMNYKLAQNLSLQSTTGNDTNAVDVLYHVDKK